MKLFIIIALCLAAAGTFGDDAPSALDQKYVPRYTLLSDSKKQEQDMDAAASVANEQSPWRRSAYTSGGGHGGGQQTGWSGSGQGTSPAALHGPGLMLLGVNLGALLYMLLGLLGLAPPPHRIGGGGAYHAAADFYRNERPYLGAGKDTDLYL